MTKYEIRDGDKWVTAKKAAPAENRLGTSFKWLHYELSDGTNGRTFNGPNQLNWRIKQSKESE